MNWFSLPFFSTPALPSLLSSTPIHHCNINYIRLVFPACLHPHPRFQIFFSKVSLFLSFFFSLLSSSDLVFPLHGKPKSVSPVRVLALTPDTSCPSPPFLSAALIIPTSKVTLNRLKQLLCSPGFFFFSNSCNDSERFGKARQIHRDVGVIAVTRSCVRVSESVLCLRRKRTHTYTYSLSSIRGFPAQTDVLFAFQR